MGMTPVNVHGGWRIMDVVDVRRGDYIETDYEWCEESEVLYPSEVEAELVIQGMRTASVVSDGYAFIATDNRYQDYPQ